MTRGEIAGSIFWIGLLFGVPGYYYYARHTPTAIAKANAQRAEQDRVTGQIFAQVQCADNIKRRDDGKMPAETVAKAIIAKCGPFTPFNASAVCHDTKCMQSLQQTSLKVQIGDVLEERYERAQARADDAKAALERAH
ncbi:hypothetical protein LVY65_05045 [Sphingomonas sp. G124]|uniref:Uncharacterized protein n=1 Tax=Sphingomonas cremea TaxID=2904799 RepID=A0A9X1TY32_9SPHN|nr:hypothetical protein [Sphingomonas cremea]MCF2514432.1 hypothetical protein [Sphingomonas cremea]